ncbi:MAG: hypothetical protein UHI93_05795, partial [Acutalibacteraceae bacterium]|nr:hypothetical protein [Acutalibacteraceae bacterium]
MKRNVKMKILIALVFTILILAIIAGFFMHRRGDGEVRSAYDYTKVTTVTATKKAQKTTVKESGKTTKKAETKKADTTTTTLKKSQRKVTIPGTYVSILNRQGFL